MDEQLGIAIWGGALVLGGLLWLVGGWRWFKRALILIGLALLAKSAFVSPAARLAAFRADMAQLGGLTPVNYGEAVLGLAAIILVVLAIRAFSGFMSSREPVEEIEIRNQTNRPTDEQLADNVPGNGPNWVMDYRGVWNKGGLNSDAVFENYRDGNEIENPIGTRGGVPTPHDINARAERERRH